VAALGRASSPSHLLVVGLVLRKDFLPHLLLPLVDVRVQLVSVLSNREFLVVVNWDEDFLRANWLLVGVVELSYIWMLESLLSCKPLVWVELKKVFQQVDGVV
jgi:hypothetical protein